MFFALALSMIAAGGAPASFTLTVDAGATDREWSVVTAPLPESLAGKPLELTDQKGARQPVQVAQMADGGKRLVFIVSALRAGTRAVLKLRASPAAARPEDGGVT